MKSLNESHILDALKSVKDPDLHRDIVTLGFVKDLKIEGRDVSFMIELTTPACPVRDELKDASIKAIRAGIEGVERVDVTMTSNVSSAKTSARPDILPAVKNTIAVASGKGGVGKSTLAVNLAAALAKDGARVGLVDTDVYGPSIPLMMGISERPKQHLQRIQPLEKWGVKVMSIGFFLDPMQAVIWRGPMASGAVRQFLSDVDWGELDYLLFDLPPGTGDIQLTLTQTIPLTGAVVVTTPQDISLADARKAFVMFQKVNVPVLGIVENMSYYVCAHCGNRDEVFDHGGGNRAAEELGVPFLGAVPIYTGIRISGDRGIPFVLNEDSESPATELRSIARSMAARVSIRNAGGDSSGEVEISLFNKKTS